ncbi:SUF system Fe-S cluster assembly regulator [Azoarcus sp. KH32C]|uniref:SUF system Fe-S cluster assembly regulator n=1 Tax=Azoarcus sp. KH32C TaxID=748247 RepID=UPI0002386160|nr:SUF system Fe-S cluster assembly regulator [Azoarcus sp. KH32C]BAL25097.1 BadM/Rrf2 family transcriptional regulator [Azoarcus sp. KH32C]
MLRVSKLGDYGTMIMVHMARQPLRLFSACDMAEATGLGPATVSKLMKCLAREGLLVSHRGTHGGYRLAREPTEISIAQIVDAVEGPVGVTECSVAAGTCAQEATCTVRAGWQGINSLLRASLENVRLAEFARTTEGMAGDEIVASPGE